MESTAIEPAAEPQAPPKSALERIFEILGGPSGVSRCLGAAGITITPWAVNKWLRQGRLPRTEYTGETTYARVLAAAAGGQVSAEELLDEGRRKQPAA